MSLISGPSSLQPWLFRLLGRLPLRALHGLGALLGGLGYLGSPGYRRHLRENLARALAGDEAAQRASRIRRQAVAHAGRGLLELPFIWTRPLVEVAARIREVRGAELVAAVRQQGCGLLILTPHLGSFEMIGQYYAVREPLTALYRKPRQAWLQPFIEAGRGRGWCRLAPADLSGVRQILKSLQRGETVCILPDQVPSAGEGQWAPFFGRPAYTMTLAARLSEMKQVSVLFAWVERLPRGRGFILHFSAPESAIEGSREARVRAINRELEGLIRRCPEQYLWGYHRYKTPRGAELSQPPRSA